MGQAPRDGVAGINADDELGGGQVRVGERRMGNKKFPTRTKTYHGDVHLREGMCDLRTLVDRTAEASLAASKFGHRRGHWIRGQNAWGWAPIASTRRPEAVGSLRRTNTSPEGYRRRAAAAVLVGLR